MVVVPVMVGERTDLELPSRLLPCGVWGTVGHRCAVVELGRWSGRGWSLVGPSLGLRAAPAAECCVETHRNVGEAGGTVSRWQFYHDV